MKSTITVRDRKEAAYIRAGLEQPDVRAFVVTMGILAGLPDDNARRRVLNWTTDVFDNARRQTPLPFHDGTDAGAAVAENVSRRS